MGQPSKISSVWNETLSEGETNTISSPHILILHPLNLPLKNDIIKHPLSIIDLAAARGFCKLDTIPGNFQEARDQVYSSRWPWSFSLEAFRSEAKLARA